MLSAPNAAVKKFGAAMLISVGVKLAALFLVLALLARAVGGPG